MGFVAVVLAIAIPVTLVVGAVLLRAAVSIANSCLGDQRPVWQTGGYEEWDEWEDEEETPRRSSRSRKAKVIPEPGVGQGMIIVFVATIVSLIIGGVLDEATGGIVNARGDAYIAVVAVVLVLNFLIMSLLLSTMLPTSFGLGSLVSMFFLLICIAISVAVLAGVYAIGMGLR